MSKIIDITDKLTFEENPKIKIRDVEIELNANALDLIDVIKTFNDDFSIETAEKISDTLFASEEDKKKVRSLNLNMSGLMTLFTECIKIVVGGDGDEGEDQTPAMT